MEQHPRGEIQHDILNNSFTQNLDLLGDVLWMVTYLLLIWIAFRDRVPGIPAIAICLNFTWELVYTVAHPPPNKVHLIVQLFWLALDCVIVYQVFRFGNRPPMTKRHYNIGFLVGIVLAFFGHLIYLQHYAETDPYGSVLAYFINLVMSLTFITMFYDRPDRKGISQSVAWTKMLATAVITLSVFLQFRNDIRPVGMMLYLGLCTAIFDTYYIYLVHAARREANLPSVLDDPEDSAALAAD